MISRFSITTPKETPATAKQETTFKLGRGVIYKLEIDFPPGPKGLLHLAIRRGLHQIWPTNPDEDFAADNRLISFSEHYELLKPPYVLVAQTWNTDDTYSHSVIVRIGILPRKYVVRRLL